MSIKNKIIIGKGEIENAILKTPTMGAAASFLNIDWRTFKKLAVEYDLYKPKRANQFAERFETEDILKGLHPQYPTSKLSKRLVKEGYKEYRCESCGITEYNHKAISLELNHINGKSSDHSLDNLELLCPNCHSQTDTYRSKKLKIKTES